MGVELRRKKLKGGKESLYLDIYHQGRRQYEFLKLYTKPGNREANRQAVALAERIRANRELEMESAGHGIVPAFKRKACFVEYFKKLGEGKGLSSHIWSNVLNHLSAYAGGTVQFQHVNERWLEDFQAFLTKRISRNTAVTYYSKIKAALHQAVRDRTLAENPADRANNLIGKVEAERVFLTIEDLQKLSLAIPEDEAGRETARAFLFGCFSGLSVANLRSLSFGQIEGDSLRYYRTKTKTWVYLPLSKTALSLLGDLSDKPESEKVFRLPSQDHSYPLLTKWQLQAGLRKHITWHTSRHTFATLALSNGADLYTVSKLIGHADIKTTMIYAKVVDQAKRRAGEALPKLELN